MRMIRTICFAGLSAALSIFSWPAPAQVQLTSAGYTAEQAAQGKVAYAMHCAACTGTALSDAEFGPALKGFAFSQQWGGETVDKLFIDIVTTMPVAAPRSLGDETYAAILAYVLQSNGVSPGTQALASDPQSLSTLVMPVEETYGPGALVGGITLPPVPDPGPSPLDDIAPVTEAMLTTAAPAGDWLTSAEYTMVL